MVNGVNGLTTTLQTKLSNVNLEDGLSAEEATAVGLSQAEIDAIKAAGITVADDVVAVDLEEDTETADAATEEAGAGNVTVPMPAETIDEEATEQLRAEIERVRADYDLAKAESEELADKIDEKEDEYDALQAQLKSAVGKVEDAAIDANEEVAIEVNRIRQQAQEEGWPESKLKTELGNIGIPSISGEQRTLESVGLDVSDLAKIITNLSDLYASQADTVDALAERWGGFLEVDLSSIHVDTTGKIVVNEAGTGGPEVSGADGVSTLDMQKFSNMTNEALTAYMQSAEGNALLTAMQGMANEGVNLTAENCAAILKTMISEQDKSTGDASKFGTQYEDNIQVNQINGASKEELEAAVKKIQKPAEETPRSNSCDPYVINIDGVEYTMILDNNDGKWDTDDILGIDDTKDNLFEALKGLESDGDASALTGDELAKAGIRLVAKNEDGTLATGDTSKDFDLSKVKSIDMTKLRQSSDNDGNVGTFGHFDMTLTDGRTITGQETFEELSTLQKLFGAVKNFFTSLGNVASDIIEKLKIDKDEKEWYSEGIKAKVAQVTQNTDTTVDDMLEGSDALLDSANEATIDAAENYEAPVVEEQQAPQAQQEQAQADAEQDPDLVEKLKAKKA